MNKQSLLQWQKLSGKPMAISDLTLIPQACALVVRLPWAVYVWTRPTAVWVKHAGETERLPIVDLTRNIQMGLFGLSAMMALILTITGFMRLARRSGGGQTSRKKNFS